MAKRRKVGRGGPQRRVSAKIRTLIHEGVPDGRGQAGAMAHSMERAKRLGEGGKYHRVGRGRKRRGSSSKR
jgi:hypothetical protein